MEMRFFGSSGVYLDDVRDVVKSLDGAIAPLQTLCDSPRKSEQNDEALKMALEARRCIADVLTAPQLTDKDAENLEHKSASPGSSM